MDDRMTPLRGYVNEHLRDYTSAVMVLGELVPEVVTEELTREGKLVRNEAVARLAMENTRNAWRSSDAFETGLGIAP